MKPPAFAAAASPSTGEAAELAVIVAVALVGLLNSKPAAAPAKGANAASPLPPSSGMPNMSLGSTGRMEVLCSIAAVSEKGVYVRQ